MSILASLLRAYERMPDAPAPGYSVEKIGWVISLNDDGTPAGKPIDLRTGDGKKRRPRPILVPQPVTRTVAIAPNFLWDKTAYALGITAGEGKRTVAEHAEFVAHHEDVLEGTSDHGLLALLRFVAWWEPAGFVERSWPEEMKDQNVVFALESERHARFIHDREAAKALWADLSTGGDRTATTCLVTGEAATVARLHPPIKGVWGGQSSGGRMVSFNLDAFESYGHEQGENAPVSDYAAFAYTTVLNRYLQPDSRHRIQIGDASTVFWADASDTENARIAESAFGAFFSGDEPAVDEGLEAGKVGALLRRVRDGEAISDVAPELADGIRFHVLGLAPNAARISIRFYVEDDFGVIAENYRRFVEEMTVEPPPRDGRPPLWRYLLETAVLGKRENVPRNLAGEWMRAILTGTPYPLTLLSTVLMRIRADGHVNALRVAILKAVLIRNLSRREASVALDKTCTDRGYLLGRLFATYEHVQRAALGPKVNATVKDKFYGAASAQPQKVFGLLDSGAANHFAKVGKESVGRKIALEKQLGEIMDLMEPSAQPFPAHLSGAEQAMFALGYHHQYSDFFKKKDAPESPVDADAA
ncbi:MAG: type I-C CRISPR-associated protein Cas8c/Csd1 [Pseudomonadota bacterium]